MVFKLMNSTEKRMLEILKELKQKHNILAVKAEFEAEGTRKDELVNLANIVARADLDLHVKIGGCEAVRDMHECRTFGVGAIIAPMIESPFAMKKYLQAIDAVYTKEEQENMLYVFNAETITGYNNLDGIIAVPGFKEHIDSVSVGRVDFSASLGLNRDDINTDKVTPYLDTMLRKCHAAGIKCGFGGGVSPETIPVFEQVKDVLYKFETRKVVYRYFDELDVIDALILGQEFELLYLKNKNNLYTYLREEDVKRIEMLEKRHIETKAKYGK